MPKKYRMILNMQVSYFGSVSVCVTRTILSAVSCASNGQWDDVWEVVKDNKGIILGVFVPLGLVLRWPAAVFAVARVGLVAAEGVVYTVVFGWACSEGVGAGGGVGGGLWWLLGWGGPQKHASRFKFGLCGRWLWSQLVNHALTKKRRGKSSRK
jgi:hypothetical protein